MGKERDETVQKMEAVADELKKQFDDIGRDVKEQLLKDFDAVLSKDIGDLKQSIGRFVSEQNQRLLKQSQQELQKAIQQEFGGSVFGGILGNAIIPGLFDSVFSGRSFDFKAASAQGLLQIGKAIAKSQFRNG